MCKNNTSYHFSHVKSYILVHKNSNSHIVIVSNDSIDDADKLVKVTGIYHKIVKADYSEANFQCLCYLPNQYECC